MCFSKRPARNISLMHILFHKMPTCNGSIVISQSHPVRISAMVILESGICSVGEKEGQHSHVTLLGKKIIYLKDYSTKIPPELTQQEGMLLDSTVG